MTDATPDPVAVDVYAGRPVTISTNRPSPNVVGAGRAWDHDDRDDRDDAAYLAEIDRVLVSLPGTTTLDEFFAATHGAFPSLVAERCRLLPVHPALRALLDGLSDGVPSSVSRVGHEPHPLDYEWYFTQETADSLAATMPDGSVLCLGVPTVAESLAALGRYSTLVDRNPLTLDEVTTRSPSVTVVEGDIPSTPDVPSSDLVVLDPPWYEWEFRQWLLFAAECTNEGGHILMPLVPSLVRPSAHAERSRLLDLAAGIGRVATQPRSLRYETPLFEYEVLRRNGLPLSRPWRTADLLIVTVERPRALPPWHVSEPLERWATYAVGGQTVKVRMGGHDTVGRTGPVVEEVPGCPDLFFDSVSRRDPRRALIDVWTSRNRVASSRDLAAAGAVFEALASGASVRELTARSLLSTGDAVLLDRLLDRAV